MIDALLLDRRDLGRRRVAAPGLEQHALVGQLLLDPVEVGVGLVDLVDRDDDRHLRGAGVVDRLDGLRHHAVVGGDDEDDDVRRPRAARAHRGEGLVAGRVEEDDRLAVDLDPVRADVLRDPAGLAGGDVRLADRVEKGRLAVVDVAHDGDDRRARRRAERWTSRRFPWPERESSISSSKETTAASTPTSLAIWTAVAASSVWLTVARTPRCIRSRWMSRASTPSFSESSLTVTPSVKKTGPVGAGFLNSRSLPESCARVSFAARRIADFETGRASASRLVVGAGLLDQRQRDVGVGVFLVGSDELAQIDLVGDGDLRPGAPLAGRRLLGVLVVLLALGPGSALAAARREPCGRRRAGTRRSAERTGARAAGGRPIDRRAGGARAHRPSESARGTHRAARRRAEGPIGRLTPPEGPMGRARRRAGPARSGGPCGARPGRGGRGRGGRTILRGTGAGPASGGSARAPP